MTADELHAFVEKYSDTGNTTCLKNLKKKAQEGDGGRSLVSLALAIVVSKEEAAKEVPILLEAAKKARKLAKVEGVGNSNSNQKGAGVEKEVVRRKKRGAGQAVGAKKRQKTAAVVGVVGAVGAVGAVTPAPVLAAIGMSIEETAESPVVRV